MYYRRAYGTLISSPPVTVSLSEAVSHIKSGERVYIHSVAATPSSLLTALSQRHSELRNVELCHLHLEKINPCSRPEYAKSFFTNNFFVGANQRDAVAQGYSSLVPVFLSEVPKLLRNGHCTPDWVLLNVSPPDKHGYCSLGVEVATAYPATLAGKKIIAQFNKNMPRTHGYSAIHMHCFDYIVPNVDEPLPEVKNHGPTPAEQAIGKLISDIVPDGACLQMGIGNIPNAVLAELKHHQDLGIHTEMFAEGVIDLFHSGAITNMKKSFLPGKILTSFVMGSKRLYDFVDDNPDVIFMDSSVVNDPQIIGRNKKVVAINSAIEVDITGQVCADSVGTSIFSGVGGQVDFERGAAVSRGGIPIICLPSTTKHGESRIVSMLKPGAGVITSRNHVHYVVTEYGCVDLFGKNLLERAKAMISLAHPNHRADLEQQAYERFKIKAWNV